MKAIIIKLMCAVLLTGAIPLAAQSPVYFSKNYCPHTFVSLSTNVLTTDSGYFVFGSYNDTLLGGQQRLCVLVLDTLGTLQKEVFPSTNYLTQYYPSAEGAVTQTLDSGYIWAGTLYDGVKAKGYLIKFDHNLNVLWEHNYERNPDTIYSYLGLFSMTASTDGGFAMTGGIEEEPKNPHLVRTNILLIKTDSLGHVEWQKEYAYHRASYGYSVIQTSEKGFLIGGSGHTPGVDQSLRGIIIKTDSLGNELWRRYISSNGYHDSYCVVKNSPDGNFIVGTSLGVDKPNKEYSFRVIRLLKYDPAGTLLWDKQFELFRGFNNLMSMVVLDNGDIVSCGMIEGRFHPHNTARISWIVKVSTHGDSLWMRFHDRFSCHYCYNQLYDIATTSDGGFVMTGVADSLHYIRQNIWVLKVDSLGCAVPGCHLVGLREVIMPPEEVLLYPNPATTYLTMRLPSNLIHEQKEVRVFNSAGHEVLRQPLSTGEPEPTLDIYHLPAGIYYLRVIHRDISTVLGRFIKN